ncbi:zf-HC2 domain-containing protein [Arachnia propionica]|uniref:zf-HC2 domain-containing protein n=1 Tax=Arachnia propionica TaxID=1750 RepID=UPI0028E87508|nr:zf-HC2 domain-containing protein [Arachnia propionica]
MRGNDCRRYEDDLSGFVDQTLPERRVNQVSEHLVRCPECSAAVDELRRVRSRLNSCRAAATLPETLAERLQGIAGNECDQPLYLAGDGPRRHSRGGRLIRGGMAATVALATLMMLSLALAKEPAVVGDPVRAAREQYSLALTTISVGQGVGAVQWARERGARPGAATQLSPRTFDLGQAVPIDESNAMIRLGNNGQSITYSGRQRVWLMDGDGVHRPNDVEVDVVAGEGATLAVLDGTGERFLSWFVPTMGCCSSLAETGWQFYTYQSSDTVAGRSASVVEARGDGHLVARWWLDDDTGLPLWVERYDTTGRPTLVFGFVSINIGTAQLATDSTQPYPMESVSSANTSGWCVGLPECPLELGGLPLVAHASSGEGQNVYQRLVYSDGVRTLSVSWTPGVLAGGIRVSDDSPGLPQVSAWQVGDGVVSVATNGPRALMAEACKALPKPQENKYGLLERMGSGLGRLVGIG